MIIINKKANLKLNIILKPGIESKFQLVLCIDYLVQYNKESIQVLIDLKSKENIIKPSFAKKLGFYI